MSVTRDVIADAHGVPEDRVRCKNCENAARFVNDAYICEFWHQGLLADDAFCDFWEEKKDGKTR